MATLEPIVEVEAAYHLATEQLQRLQDLQAHHQKKLEEGGDDARVSERLNLVKKELQLISKLKDDLRERLTDTLQPAFAKDLPEEDKRALKASQIDLNEGKVDSIEALMTLLANFLQTARQEMGEQFDRRGIFPKWQTLHARQESLLSDYSQERLQELERLQVEAKSKRAAHIVESGESQLLYVYLYNSAGDDLSSWAAMLSQDTLREYAVTRPVYQEVEHLEVLFRSRDEPERNGYVAIKVAESNIVGISQQDKLGQPLITLSENAFFTENIEYFFHQRTGKYTLSETGELIKVAEP